MKSAVLALCLMCLSSGVLAQVPGDPTINTDFRTYRDAILGLVAPLRQNAPCQGLPNDFGFQPPDPGFDQLSLDLQLLCSPVSNGSSGGTLSGGFTEPFATRTFLPFQIDTTRPTPPQTDDPAPLGFGAGQLSFSFLPTSFSAVFSDPTHWMTLGVEGVSFGVDSSDFETGRDGSGFGADLVLGRRLAGGSALGIGLSFRTRDSDLSETPFLFESANVGRSPVDVAAAVASARDYCSGLERGRETSDTIELNGLYAATLSANTTFQLFGGVQRARGQTTSPLCFFQVGDNPSEDIVLAGHLSGSPEAVTASFGGQAERQWAMGRARLFGRVGAEARSRRIDGYTQSETPAANSPLLSNEAVIIPVEATGLALRYEDREVFTVTTELGLRSVWAFGGARNSGAFWVDASYQHVFGDTDERVSASFAGDGRAIPTRFTFQGNPIADHRITLGAGVDILAFDQLATSLFVAGSFTDLSETYRVGATLNWRF